MKKQRGMALSSLIVWAIALSVVAITLMRVVPAYLEFFKLRKNIATVATQISPDSPPPEVRRVVERYFDVDGITRSPDIVQIQRRGTRVALTINYEERIHLVGNVSLLLDFAASAER